MNGILAGMFLLTLLACSASAQTLTKTGDSVVDEKALTIKGAFGQAINGKAFQQDAVVSHAGYQYVAYYDAQRHVCLARRKLPDGAWDVLRFQDYDFKSNDAHNTISLGICAQNGTIHLSFDHHNNPLHYRVSEKDLATDPANQKWSVERFGPVVSALEKGKKISITYPRFIPAPGGGLQFCYRRGGSGNGDRMLADYDPEKETWTHTRQIDSHAGSYNGSNSRCSYPNGYTYGPDGKLHATWVWREGAGTANHDLAYVYSEDRGTTWLNNQGEPLKAPASVSSPGVRVVTIHEKYGLMNTHGQAVDSQGRIHAVMYHCSEATLQAAGVKPGAERWGPPEARRYHHYWRQEDGTWQHVEMDWVSGNRPKLFFDKHDHAYLIFASQGDLQIACATAVAQWKDWKVVHIEKGPFGNEMLGDPLRWSAEGVLSVMVQTAPQKAHEPTVLRILDFKVEAP